MGRVVWVFAVLLAMTGWLASEARAVEYSIDYVVQKAQTLQNTEVTVKGLVANAQVHTPANALDKVKGEYDLSDESGATIHVKTLGKLPANGEEHTVTGQLNASGGAIFVLEKDGPPIDPKLIAALAVLVILAVVLIIQLTKKPKSRVAGQVAPAGTAANAGVPPIMNPTVSATSSAPPAPTVAPVGKICPKCRAQNDADSNFCASCREPLGAAPTSRPTSQPTVAPTKQETRASQKATVMIDAAGPDIRPLADLTVIEGSGAGYGTKFSLKKERQKIGRQDNMDIRLNDDTISREHASIWWQDGSFYIQDEASTSGTLVNGQKITRQSLSDKDTIQVGKTKLVFTQIQGPTA